MEWMPIGEADMNTVVLLYSPPENLHTDPTGKDGDMRVARPRDFCWATHYMPLPQPPGAK